MKKTIHPKVIGSGCFLLSLIFLAIAIASPVQAISYGGVGGRPAYPRSDNPRTESVFVHNNVNPGQIIQEGVLVMNNTPVQATILVDAVDAVSNASTAFACRQVGDPQKAVGTWINLAKNRVTLEPNTQEIVPFTIAIPSTASVGEHNGCIVMEAAGQTSQSSGNAIQLAFRTGLRIVLTVPGEIIRRVEVVGLKVSKQKNGDYLLTPMAKNTGNVSIDTNIKVTTHYFFGRQISQHGGQFPIFREVTADWNFDFKRPFWGGWYQARLLVEYDANPEASVGIKSGKAMTQLQGPTVWFFTQPKPLALAIEIVVFLMILAGLFVLFLRWRRKRWIKKSWQFYVISAGEDIQSLARKFDVSWKLLVKANKLKPPYTLKPGDKLKVPPR